MYFVTLAWLLGEQKSTSQVVKNMVGALLLDQRSSRNALGLTAPI